MTKNNFKSDPPDPKDFPSFEEYERALNLHEDFLEKANAVTNLINNSKTEEEYNEGMKKLGFECVEDEYCENDWCQKNEMCLAVAIEMFMEMVDKECLFGLMKEEDKIINLILDGYECDLPLGWKDEDKKEGAIILFCLDTEDSFIFNNALGVSFSELIKEKKVKEFFANLYFFLKKMLFSEGKTDKEKLKIMRFLKNNKFLKKQESKKLLKIFENIVEQYG